MIVVPPAAPPMPANPLLQDIGNLVLFAGSFLAAAFCIIYSLRASWWESEAGRFLFFLGVYLSVLMLFLSSAIGGFIRQGSLTYIVVRLVVYSLAIPILLWLISMLVRTKRPDGRIRVHETLREALDVENHPHT